MEDQRSVGMSSCNSEDGTDQRVQSLTFMMMIKNTLLWVSIFVLLLGVQLTSGPLTKP